MLEKNTNESFGQYIARLRKDKDFSQRKLALVSGVSNTTISRIENGESLNPDLGTLQALAAALGIDEASMLNAAGYLSVKKEDSDTGLDPRDLRQVQKELERIMTSFQRNPKDGFSNYDGNNNISKEDYELLENAFDTTLRVVKKLNKQTYNPNKHKNNEK